MPIPTTPDAPAAHRRALWAPLVAALAALVAAVAPAGHATAQFGDVGGFGGPPQAQDPVTVSAAAERVVVRPFDHLAIAVVMDHAESWHTWPSAAQDVLPKDIAQFAIRTEIRASRPDGITLGGVQWPEPHTAPAPNPMGDPPTVDVPLYTGKAVAYIPIIVTHEAKPGQTFTLDIEVNYQPCDDSMCLMPASKTVSVTLEVGTEEQVAAATAEDPSGPDLFAGFDSSVFAMARGMAASDDPPPPAGTPATAVSSEEAATDFVSVAIAALLAIVGGFVLNLTPCVLPVIPIKIMTLTQHAGSHARSFTLGLWMAGGVVAFWLALGVLASTVTAFADPSRLFGIWWFTAGIGLIIAVMGVGIMGAFSINLPQSVYAINPKADTPFGSFLFGVMTAVLGLPCFGFVAGALLAGAATMPAWLIMTIFTSLGVGMAAPYLVLSANPKWLDKLPRTGPASDLVKQVMGLLLLAAGAYFLGAGVLAFVGGRPDWLVAMPWWTKVIHWWVVALFAIAAGGWLIARMLKITPGFVRRTGVALIGLVLAGGGVAAAAHQSLKAAHNFWVPFTDEVLAAGLEEGHVVVLDFTAEWCLNCKAIEAAVLLKEPVRSQLVGEGVVPVKADLTSTAAPGWDKLRSLGRTGIPTLAILGPGLKEPWIGNRYTSDDVLDAIARARGTVAAAEPEPEPEPGADAPTEPDADPGPANPA